MQRKRKKKNRFGACIDLTKEQVDYLNNISRCCGRSGGRKLSKTAIVRALLTALKKLDINVKRVRNEKQLRAKIVGAFCKYK